MTVDFKENGRTYLLIAGATILLILPFVLLAIRQSHNKAAKKITAGEYYDANSRETVSAPPGKTPENFGGTAGQPVYLGFGNLLTIGISKFQLDAIKYGFEQYASSAKQNISEVSLKVDSITTIQHDSNDPNSKDVVTFDVTLNRTKNYQAKIEYYDISVIRLYLLDPNTKAIVYDSKPIDRTGGGE